MLFYQWFFNPPFFLFFIWALLIYSRRPLLYLLTQILNLTFHLLFILFQLFYFILFLFLSFWVFLICFSFYCIYLICFFIIQILFPFFLSDLSFTFFVFIFLNLRKVFFKYYYDDENQNDVNAIANFKDLASILPTYKKMKTNALPTAKIIDEIKSIYPQIHNLFVKLLEIKYGSTANKALMQVQDAEQALKDAQLQGQIQKIKVKKLSKLELAKK